MSPCCAATNGVVLATEKKMSSALMDPTSIQKICHLTEAAGIVYSGMGPDFRVLVKKGRKAAQQYFRQYQVRRAVKDPHIWVCHSQRAVITGANATLPNISGARNDDAGVHAARVCLYCCEAKLDWLLIMSVQWRAAVWGILVGGWLR